MRGRILTPPPPPKTSEGPQLSGAFAVFRLGVRSRFLFFCSLSLSLFLSLFFFSLLSLYLSAALFLALALASFVPVTEGAWARVPPIITCPWRQSHRRFQKKTVLWAHWNFLGLCFMSCYIWFQEFCALDTSECWNFQDVCASGA